MGSTDSLEDFVVTANSQDLETSTPFEVGVSGNSPRDWEKLNLNFENNGGENRSTGALSDNNQAPPSDCETKIASEDKDKKMRRSPRFKREVTCVSSSQPICGNNVLNKKNLHNPEQKHANTNKTVRTSLEVGVSGNSQRDREKPNLNFENIGGENRSTGAFSANNEAPPRDGETKIAWGDKDKKVGRSPTFKRKFTCVSSSQPIGGNNLDSGIFKRECMECKKQAQMVVRMSRRADRAKEKLKRVRSQLKILNDILSK